MRTKKQKKFIITISIVAVIILALLAYLFLIRPAFSGPKQSFTLYFLDSTGSCLSPEKRSITVPDRIAGNDEKLLELLVEELIAGPKEQLANTRAIPEKTRLLSLEIDEDKIATVNLSKAFYANSDLENTLAVHTIVLTLCDTRKVNKVAVLIDGKEIISKSKVALGALGPEDIQNAADPQQASIPLTVILYYPSRDGEHLLIEERTLQADGAKVDATIILNELIKGTTSENAVNLIPASTKVLHCETKEGICYVNLSQDFIDKRPSGSTSETLVIQSIVQTLTELNDVTKVMFLIEGEKVETYGQMVFNEPFERMSTEPEVQESLSEEVTVEQ